MSISENRCQRTLRDLTLESELVNTSVQNIEEIKDPQHLR